MATAGLGCLIFIDDYFNCLSVGTVMRPVTDKHRISRAKLAYLLDATAAPICIIAPISSWGASVATYMQDAGAENGMTTFVSTIPYNLYALLTIKMCIRDRYKTVVGMVKGMLEEMKITVPVALHLDHGGYEGCLKCVEAGFSSIMFDGSHYPIDENVAKTSELVKICAEKGMSLEAEVGAIGGEEDGVVGNGEVADPKECKAIADLGVDMLAAGIGNIHGKYPANWKGLNFEVLDEISKLTGDMPLVLHGGTAVSYTHLVKGVGSSL